MVLRIFFVIKEGIANPKFEQRAPYIFFFFYIYAVMQTF